MHHPESMHSLTAVLAYLQTLPPAADRDAMIAELEFVLREECGEASAWATIPPLPARSN